MDNALCGGAGQTLSGGALKAVKAAVFMGDPRNVAGLSYNVGTCKAKGVRFCVSLDSKTKLPSLLLVPKASAAHPLARLDRTATGQTLTVAMDTIRIPINSMLKSMGPKL